MEDKIKDVPSPDLQPGGAGSDNAAVREASGFAEKNLDEVSREKEYGRKDQFRDHASWAAIGILWLITAATALALIFLAWHFLAPTSLHWLTDWQLTAVKAYIFSGAVVAAITGYMRKHLE